MPRLATISWHHLEIPWWDFVVSFISSCSRAPYQGVYMCPAVLGAKIAVLSSPCCGHPKRVYVTCSPKFNEKSTIFLKFFPIKLNLVILIFARRLKAYFLLVKSPTYAQSVFSKNQNMQVKSKLTGKMQIQKSQKHCF